MRSDSLRGVGMDLDVLGLGHAPQHGPGTSMQYPLDAVSAPRTPPQTQVLMLLKAA